MRAMLLVVLLGGCDWVLSLKEFPHDAPVTEGRWAHVAASLYFTCAIDLDGRLFCWGYDADDELGTGGSEYEYTTPQLIVDGTWTSVTGGFAHACGLQIDGSLWCWGSNYAGQFGNGTTTSAPAPVHIGTKTWKAVAAHANHTCAIDNADALFCWGENLFGELGNGSTGEQDAPVLVSGPPTWLQVSLGVDHTCGLTTTNQLYCWGANYSGQLGNNTAGDSTTPSLVAGSWAAVSSGAKFSCGLGTDGRIRCWGSNATSSLGDGSTQDFRTPHALLTSDTDFIAVATGGTHGCALHADHSMVCWGDPTPGPLVALSAMPVAIDGPRWAEVSLGETHGCGITVAHHLFCVGDGTSGAIGNGQTGPHAAAIVATNVGAIAANNNETCAVGLDGSLTCWGANNHGQVGNGSRIRALAPVAVGLAGVTKIVVGHGHACALNSTGASCWGYQGLGAGATDTSDIPIPVISLPNGFTNLAAGGDSSCVYDTTHVPYCWGANDFGQLGIGSLANPVDVPTLTTGSRMFKSMAVAYDYACGVDNNGTMWCTGDNRYGQVGANSTNTTFTSYTQTIPMTGIYAAVFGGDTHACAVNAANVAFCWGRGFYGELGNHQSIGAVLSPTQVNIAGAWTKLALGGTHTCGVHTDGTVACWGRNELGELGNGTTDSSMDPVPVAGPVGVTQLVSGQHHTCALDRDNAVWCWGSNHDGQVGNDTGWVHAFVEVPAP